MEARIAIEPSEAGSAARANEAEDKRRREEIIHAVKTAGGSVVPVKQANGLAWLAIDGEEQLAAILDANPQIAWVQLPWAGVENFAAKGVFSRPIQFTCAKTAFSGQVGEQALMLILAGLRGVVEQARSLEWREVDPESLENKRVTILGAGGIAECLTPFLLAADCKVTVLRRNDVPFPGASRTLPISSLHEVLPETDVLVIALALTPETTGVIGTKELALLPTDAVLVNVARGLHIDTAALVDALERGRLKAVGLDVTEPEPLPPEHPLWSMANVLITSHCGNSPAYATEQLAERVKHNVVRFREGNPLIGLVDPEGGY